jgi:hypothetical protein
MRIKKFWKCNLFFGSDLDFLFNFLPAVRAEFCLHEGAEGDRSPPKNAPVFAENGYILPSHIQMMPSAYKVTAIQEKTASKLLKSSELKGAVARDFRRSVFFHQTIPPRALIHAL